MEYEIIAARFNDREETLVCVRDQKGNLNGLRLFPDGKWEIQRNVYYYLRCFSFYPAEKGYTFEAREGALKSIETPFFCCSPRKGTLTIFREKWVARKKPLLKVLGAYSYSYCTKAISFLGNSQWEDVEIVAENYEICLLWGDIHYTLSLGEREVESASGYCARTEGYHYLRQTDNTDKITMLPKGDNPYIEGWFYEDDLPCYSRDDIENVFFYCSEDGGDGYYPAGEAGIHEEMWEPIDKSHVDA